MVGEAQGTGFSTAFTCLPEAEKEKGTLLGAFKHPWGRYPSQGHHTHRKCLLWPTVY